MEEKIFIRVPNVKFSDLPDWSHPEDKHQNVSDVNSSMSCSEKQRKGGPLHLGDIEDVPGKGFCVRCPWHNWRIGLDSGSIIFPHGRTECALSYPVKIKSCGSILIGFDKFSDAFFDISQDF